MYFLQEDKNIHQYICQHELWVPGRVVDLYNSNTNKKEKMLEPLWRKYNANLEGVMVFLSRIEATIYSIHLEKKFSEKWAVYSLNEFNIKEMMIHNQRVKKSEDYNVLLSAGFWANKDNQLMYSGHHLVQVTIPITYNSNAVANENGHAILRIPSNVIEHFEKYWKSRFADFKDYTEFLAGSNNEIIQEQALLAYNNLSLIESNSIEDCQYITTWKNNWIFNNPENLTLIK
ncbi:TPA: hypothetical protein ACYRSE_001930 [Klebsiella michiganensis]|uniref:DUF3841 domain-containing protein n=2 Tax=Klebsiella michiganensis TaxID=1134687 RepID=A0A0H3H471_KLEM8|nr:MULTISPECIES: hypothetical protein [Klebsiella]AEX02392.1 hypothetical protein KOX_03265 [Klebsiella michiganensis KCTC 1686]AHW86849.1 hypothetical protein J415_06500 [Klebsiella michiganensis HKOPL1]ASK74084.1 hypothetical protein CF000_13710 [Klebsiella michiganensis]ASZ56711.1 hypothetical protein CKQ55_16495 [Klebsiella michiganensis]ELG9970657.1 hypothetical protein [Klebsiella michiganensis]